MLAKSARLCKRPEAADVSTGSGLVQGRSLLYAPGRFIWQLVGVLDT